VPSLVRDRASLSSETIHSDESSASLARASGAGADAVHCLSIPAENLKYMTSRSYGKREKGAFMVGVLIDSF